MNETNSTTPPTARREGLVVLGTPETIHSALSQLDTMTTTAVTRPFGVVVLDEGSRECAEAMGMRVLGIADELEAIFERTPFATALICLPGAMQHVIDRARLTLGRLGVDVRRLPTLEDILSGAGVATGHGVGLGGTLDVQSLIGRAPTAVDPGVISRAVMGRRVLITGAGGSIGSEIARICAEYDPSEIILMERAENALFEIDSELGRRNSGVARRAILHDVVDAEGTLHRFAKHRPEVVFHAAAHKHVPMMEDHPAAALNNNLFGTKSVADAARACGCERFVLISTDKAVNPSSVMGATKRLAELYVRSLNGLASCRYNLVRFGNVLGSACSVLPIWTRQLSEGGPLTVTHEEMTRYFMTIPEAASLVIQSATLDSGLTGGVFELDMGEAVRIRDLADRFVRLHGFEPVFEGGDANDGGGRSRVAIRFSGIRPGEKLHEELAYQAEALRPTTVPGILAWDGDPPRADWVSGMVRELSTFRRASGNEPVMEAIGRFVPSLPSRETQADAIGTDSAPARNKDATGVA